MSTLGIVAMLWSTSLNAQTNSELETLLYETENPDQSIESLEKIRRICAIVGTDSSTFGYHQAQKGLELAKAMTDDLFTTQFKFYKALFLEKMGELDSAELLYAHSAREAEVLKDHRFELNGLMGQAVIAQKRGDFDEALQLLHGIRPKAESHKKEDDELHKLYLRSIDLTGDVYYFKGVNDSALYWYDHLIELEDTKQFPSIQAIAYKSKSALMSTIGNLPESIDLGLKALALFEQIQDVRQQSQTLNELGRAYSRLRENDKALEYYQASLAIKEKLGNREGMAVTYLNLGAIYNRQRNYGMALETFNKSYELKEALGIKKGLDALNINIGLAHKALGDLQKAESYYLKAIDLANELGNKNNHSIALSNMSSLYLSLEEFGKARDYGLLAVEAAKELNNKSRLNNSYYNLHAAQYFLGDFESAYENYAMSVTYQDSVTNERTAARIARIEKEYEKEKEERQIELQNKQLALLEAEEKLANNQKNTILIAALLLAIISAYIIRSLILKGKRQRLAFDSERKVMDLNAQLAAQEIEHQNLSREYDQLRLSSLSKEIASKNAQVNQLEEDLERLTQNYMVEQAKEHKGLAEMVLDHGKNGDDWQRFMEYFQNVYHDFLGNLKREHPSITANELRLCALLKINLSTKEIANMLNITPESLRTAKYRLRKKLDLMDDDRLNDFILKY